ncbi:MAG: cytidine deaminase [bacterium]
MSSLLNKAREAQKKAVAPFSNFPVGAALETTSGKIYTGCNIEVSSYSLTICAERVAVFKAISEGESEFNTMVIATDTTEFCPPCGACRQVLAEYAPAIKIVLVNSKGLTKHTTISELLPEAFNKNFLKNLKKI